LKNGGKVRIIKTQSKVDMKQYRNKTTNEIVEAEYKTIIKTIRTPIKTIKQKLKRWEVIVPTARLCQIHFYLEKKEFKKLYEEINE